MAVSYAQHLTNAGVNASTVARIMQNESIQDIGKIADEYTIADRVKSIVGLGGVAREVQEENQRQLEQQTRKMGEQAATLMPNDAGAAQQQEALKNANASYLQALSDVNKSNARALHERDAANLGPIVQRPSFRQVGDNADRQVIEEGDGPEYNTEIISLQVKEPSLFGKSMVDAKWIAAASSAYGGTTPAGIEASAYRRAFFERGGQGSMLIGKNGTLNVTKTISSKTGAVDIHIPSFVIVQLTKDGVKALFHDIAMNHFIGANPPQAMRHINLGDPEKELAAAEGIMDAYLEAHENTGVPIPANLLDNFKAKYEYTGGEGANLVRAQGTTQSVDKKFRQFKDKFDEKITPLQASGITMANDFRSNSALATEAAGHTAAKGHIDTLNADKRAIIRSVEAARAPIPPNDVAAGGAQLDKLARAEAEITAAITKVEAAQAYANDPSKPLKNCFEVATATSKALADLTTQRENIATTRIALQNNMDALAQQRGTTPPLAGAEVLRDRAKTENATAKNQTSTIDTKVEASKAKVVELAPRMKAGDTSIITANAKDTQSAYAKIKNKMGATGAALVVDDLNNQALGDYVADVERLHNHAVMATNAAPDNSKLQQAKVDTQVTLDTLKTLLTTLRGNLPASEQTQNQTTIIDRHLTMLERQPEHQQQQYQQQQQVNRPRPSP